MPVSSYLIYPVKGQNETLKQEFSTLAGCELTPSTDNKAFILVTECDSQEEEKKLQESFRQFKSIECMSLVFGNMYDKRD